ncbi:uncharacterized protein V6R79_024111 [Siganus canaliculatus]
MSDPPPLSPPCLLPAEPLPISLASLLFSPLLHLSPPLCHWLVYKSIASLSASLTHTQCVCWEGDSPGETRDYFVYLSVTDTFSSLDFQLKGCGSALLTNFINHQ